MVNPIRNQVAAVSPRINVTPMVDVMLVLLIIFMVITPLLQPGLRVQLANTANPLQMPDADREDALVVTISRDSQVFLGNEKISTADLMQIIRDRIADRGNKTVFVKADARTRYSAVAGVVDTVRSAGVSELGLLTERRRQ